MTTYTKAFANDSDLTLFQYFIKYRIQLLSHTFVINLTICT